MVQKMLLYTPEDYQLEPQKIMVETPSSESPKFQVRFFSGEQAVKLQGCSYFLKSLAIHHWTNPFLSANFRNSYIQQKQGGPPGILRKPCKSWNIYHINWFTIRISEPSTVSQKFIMTFLQAYRYSKNMAKPRRSKQIPNTKVSGSM